MKFYFNTAQIPQLKGLNFQQRMEHIEIATQKMTTPEKVLLNTLKLLLISLSFVWIFWLNSLWLIIPAIVAMVIVYPLVLRPAQYTLVSKYIEVVEIAENEE